MHYYDCPCDDCRRAENDTLFQRLLHVIERLEQELEQPHAKEYDRALRWLEAVCGGPDAVRALDAAPLRAPVPLPDDPRVAQVAGLLRKIAEQFFDAETELALRRALALVWAHDPGLVTAPVAASYVASGLIWVVGEANGVVGPDRQMTASRLRYALETPATPSTYARPIRAALRGPWEWQIADAPGSRLARPLPSLGVLGHLDLLTARTRAQLVRVREHALAARAEDRAAA